ncbi:MAG: 50S ribosomal protein L11 methyltransferase [Stellaceae bacterium]
MWHLTIDLADPRLAERVAAAVDDICETASLFEAGALWRVEGLSRRKPDIALLDVALALVRQDGAPPAVRLEKMPVRDWLAENQAGFPPIRAGRFFIHGSHWQGRVPQGAIPIVIDAATAFGTGEHATTQGCLAAIGRMAQRPRRILDIGCGTGILAIAAAKRWRLPVLATDIDPEAVRVARINAHRNGVANLVRVEEAASYRHAEIRRRAPFDLVFANILARPLVAMAPSLRHMLAPGGIAVLSGLLARQEATVLAAHRAQGLYLHRRFALEGWHTLAVTGSAAASVARGEE